MGRLNSRGPQLRTAVTCLISVCQQARLPGASAAAEAGSLAQTVGCGTPRPHSGRRQTPPSPNPNPCGRPAAAVLWCAVVQGAPAPQEALLLWLLMLLLSAVLWGCQQVKSR